MTRRTGRSTEARVLGLTAGGGSDGDVVRGGDISTTAEVSAATMPATLPTANPANFTPNVENGEVDSIWQIGSPVIIGGTFTTVANATQNKGAVYTRNRLAAFNATTGVVDTAFAPNVNGGVNAVIPFNDPASMYIVGTFTSVGTTARQRIARVSTATGQVITTFNAGTVNGQIRDIRLVGSTLYIAGDFYDRGHFVTIAAGGVERRHRCRPRLAQSPVRRDAERRHHQCLQDRCDAGRRTALGDRQLRGGGWFDRRQIAMIDLTTPRHRAGWHTNFYTSTCAWAFDAYVRDLDISADGSFPS